jgi:3'-5' exoribonuclease
MLNLTTNENLDKQPFIVRQINRKIGQNNKEYYHLQISYGIQNFDAKIWSNNINIAENITAGCFVYLWGVVKDFRGSLQIHVNDIKKIEDPDEELIKLVMPSSEINIDLVKDEIYKLIDSVKDEYLHSILTKIFKSSDVQDSFFERAAGSEIHHAYLGGLAHHTLEVTKLVKFFAGLYDDINCDLAVTAALLHDIGKTQELSGFPENKYTTNGRLLGHIYIGVNILNNAIEEIEGFPEDYKIDLEHCILSHHGTLEMGSPVVPMTLEAIALHNADRSSAEINGFHLAVQRDSSVGPWTEYNNTYKRYLKKS